jgi:hypothetical protein
MGIRGPQPSPNARRNGAKVYISPAHAEKLDALRDGESRADWLEQIIDNQWDGSMNTDPAPNPDIQAHPLWEGKTINGKFIPERIVSVSISDEDLGRILADDTTKRPVMPPHDPESAPIQPAP